MNIVNRPRRPAHSECREEERRRSAAQYKQLGVAPEIIAEVTGFTLEEIAAM